MVSFQGFVNCFASPIVSRSDLTISPLLPCHLNNPLYLWMSRFSLAANCLCHITWSKCLSASPHRMIKETCTSPQTNVTRRTLPTSSWTLSRELSYVCLTSLEAVSCEVIGLLMWYYGAQLNHYSYICRPKSNVRVVWLK